ncbi:hypothetical protein [Streptomyces sp. NPDC127084]|uniref:hypothetical protein n=1 Tax=Streptomyces sp. NPDC127084 TaxID=3347133 RepID=UPI003666D442
MDALLPGPILIPVRPARPPVTDDCGTAGPSGAFAGPGTAVSRDESRAVAVRGAVATTRNGDVASGLLGRGTPGIP